MNLSLIKDKQHSKFFKKHGKCDRSEILHNARKATLS